MIYEIPTLEMPIDQGDLIDDCPLLLLKSTAVVPIGPSSVDFGAQRALVVTQTCDLANRQADYGTVAEVFDAHRLVVEGHFKAADVKGPLRAGRIWGVHFLPAAAEHGRGEMIVDLRRLHTIPLELLTLLCRAGKRRGRVRPLYREHLAKHFADTFSRIGLPRPYETM